MEAPANCSCTLLKLSRVCVLAHTVLKGGQAREESSGEFLEQESSVVAASVACLATNSCICTDRSHRGSLHDCRPSQDRQRRPLLPLRLVLRRHRLRRVRHHRIRPRGVEAAALRPRSLDADADRRSGHRRPDLPHQGPADREGRTRGPDEDRGRAAGLHLPVHIL